MGTSEGYDAIDTELRIKEQIEYEILSQQCDKGLLDGIVALMVDTVCDSSPSVRIGCNEYAREMVRSRLYGLDSGHIEHVMDKLKENTTKVHNPRAYMLSALFMPQLQWITTTRQKSITIHMALNRRLL